MDADKTIGAIGTILFPQLSLLKFLGEQAVKAVQEKPSVTELRETAQRQEIELRMMEAQAKAAQEFAIARKIETAAEVELEEYYEYVGEGGGGIQANVNSGDVGFNANGSVRRVSKRVFKFRGGDDNTSNLPELLRIGAKA